MNTYQDANTAGLIVGLRNAGNGANRLITKSISMHKTDNGWSFLKIKRLEMWSY